MVRFDKPCRLVSGAVEYFREHLGAGDYLTEGGRVEMKWFGAGAERLGLSGPCQLEHFQNLCRGLHPVTGEKLMVRDKGGSRRVCFFGQISPPKDVSLAYLVGGDQRIAQWWDEAVRDTLKEIEATTATRVRRGGANEDRETGNMIAAVVTHDASRALDPQLHTHVCIMNLTYDGTEQRWKGVQPSGYYRHQGFFREVCYNKLAERMQAAGYELEDVRGIGFNIKGFPGELRQQFSKRRRDILAKAAVVGATSQDAMQSIAVNSRSEKVSVPTSELRAKWRTEAGEAFATIQRVISDAIGVRRVPPRATVEAAVVSAEAHLFERRSVVDGRSLIREALVAGRGDVSVQGVRAEINRRLADGILVRAGEQIASRDALAAEREFVDWAHANRRACAALGIPGELAGFEGDQRVAIAQVLGSRGRVVILQGDAGTGKTTCLRAIIAGVEQAGGRVFGCAPSVAATDVLRQDLTPAADTLQQWLVNEQLRASTRGRVLLVDEAGLVSVREMQALCRFAAANDNRLVLVGDIKQHHSVEAGDALRCLQKYAHVRVARLVQIRRQRVSEFRAAVAALARGDAHSAFRRFEKLGAIREIRNENELFRAAAADYVKLVAAGKSCLAISPVWEEIHAFTAEVRTQLTTTGVLSGAERKVAIVYPLHWTQEERRRIQNYHVGDAIVFHRPVDGFYKNELVTVLERGEVDLVVRRADGSRRLIIPRRYDAFEVGLPRELDVALGDRLLIRANSKTHGLKNGDIVEVSGFADDGALLLKDGRSIPPAFRQFSHGYATTSHSAQGRTVDHGLMFMAEAGIAAGNLKQAYVSNSRFREAQMIYTTDLVAARVAMQRPGDRALATEALEVAPAMSAHEAVWQRYFGGQGRGVGQSVGGLE